MFTKIAKIMNVIYIFAAILLLVSTCTYMTKYNYFPDFLEDVQMQFQKANDMILVTLLVSVIGIALVNITNNTNRRKYMLSNLISGTVAPTVGVIFSIISLSNIFKCMQLFEENFEDLQKYDSKYNNQGDYIYNASGMTLSLVLVIIAMLLMLSYLVFIVIKYMRDHKKVGVVNE